MFYIICAAAIFIIISTTVFASARTSFGIRRLYVALLLKIFETFEAALFWKKKNRIDISMFVKTKIAVSKLVEVESEQEDVFPINAEGKDVVAAGDDNRVIIRDFHLSCSEGLSKPDWKPFKKCFELSDIFYFTKCGIECVMLYYIFGVRSTMWTMKYFFAVKQSTVVIIEDDVTGRFKTEDLAIWNLLTRTNKGYQFLSMRLAILWFIGCFVRYCILFPFRLILLVVAILWLVVCAMSVGRLPHSKLKRTLYNIVSIMSSRMLARAASAVITFHNEENRARNGICVANHTSPIDCFVLSCDNSYALVGQIQGGLIGIIQRALGKATFHMFFERSEVKDRHLVSLRLKEHIEDEDRLPVLIFPEGTCINNTSVMMFKKGSFEVSNVVYPVAIKYDSRFSDAFWDSSKHGMVCHLFNILTSWALVCDIWYLPPMRRLEDEGAIMFANRVKREIAKRGGLVDLDWDGQLKRTMVKESYKQKPQKQYSNYLKLE